jgi:hypothetical protein
VGKGADQWRRWRLGDVRRPACKLDGAEVTGVDNTEKLAPMRSLGADHIIDYTRTCHDNDQQITKARSHSWVICAQSPK